MRRMWGSQKDEEEEEEEDIRHELYDEIWNYSGFLPARRKIVTEEREFQESKRNSSYLPA